MRILLVTRLLAVTAALALAQEATRPAATDFTQSPAPSQYERVLTIRYLDLAALCQALGGSVIDLRPLFAPTPGAPNVSFQPTLNPNAPMASFVPEGVTEIVGVVR